MDYHDIDWNDVWTEQMKRHQQRSNRKECASIWKNRENARARCAFGAGPGSVVILLSQWVAHVTVVEPSTGMVVQHLERQ